MATSSVGGLAEVCDLVQNGSDAANAQVHQQLENTRTLLLATPKIEDANAAIKLYDLIVGIYMDFSSAGESTGTLKAMMMDRREASHPKYQWQR